MSAAQSPENRGARIGLGATHVLIDADASLAELADDANCLLRSAASAIESIGEYAGRLDAPPEVGGPWFAMVYTLRAGMAAFDRLYELAHKRGEQP